MFTIHHKLQTTNYKGFTLIEALVTLFVFSLITMTFYETWSLGVRHIFNAKNRLGATALANQQMEIARSLIFDDVGTTSGIPPGTIAEYQTMSVNATNYNVHTVIQFVDDPTDGTAALATDMAPNDYKKATITVSWGEESSSEQVTVVSAFSLDGVESVAAGTGILSINILNNPGAAIANATVHTVNSAVSPVVDITANTDAGGNTTFPGALASLQSYQISVSKSGYYGNTTYPPYPTSTFIPQNVHASVVAGSLTPVTLVTDQVSTIDFHTKDPFGADVPNIDFSISGGLIIGADPGDGSAVYDYSQNTSTNSNGGKDLSDRSSGLYTVSLDAGETQYRFVRLTPEETVSGTVSLLPGTTSTVTMVLADKTFSSALVAVKNSADDTPIAGATVHVTNSTLGYDASVVTDTYGQAYFPTTAPPLVVGTYDVEISASGFTTGTGTLPITGSQLNEKEFSLDAI